MSTSGPTTPDSLLSVFWPPCVYRSWPVFGVPLSVGVPAMTVGFRVMLRSAMCSASSSRVVEIRVRAGRLYGPPDQSGN
jgi:hypothetical protein